MRLRAQARAADGAEIGIAADHQQAQPVAWDLGQKVIRSVCSWIQAGPCGHR